MVLNGIIIEHERFLKNQGSIKNESKQVELIWVTLFRVLDIDLDKVPETRNPKHKDVKTCLLVYSMESFLYKRINQISRDKDITAIESLGPFAVVLGRIIQYAQRNREDNIVGPFDVYRGIALPRDQIE